MPILEIEIVVRPGESLPDGLAPDLADRAGTIFGSSPGGTWVKVRALSRADYAENGGGPPPAVLPVFVSVVRARMPAPDALQAEVARLTTAVAGLCRRPEENVHVVYAPAAAGRQAFGGKLVPA